jgi:ComF family protein
LFYPDFIISIAGKYTETMTSIFREALTDFISLIYPRYCLACHDGLAKGEELICTRCIHELPRTGFHDHRENPMFMRIDGRMRVEYAFAFLHFQKGGRVQQLLHALKYQNHPEVGFQLGKVYGYELHKAGFSQQFDSIIPIPLHPLKQRRRGYNQSDLFAKGLGESMNLKVYAYAVQRLVMTETQTRKSKLMRWQNVEEVFRISRPDVLSGKRVLLVDDVITTGATVEACGQELLRAGCTSVSIASIAYTH